MEEAVTKKSEKKYGDWLDEWLLITRSKVKNSTYIRYKNSIEKHVKPSLGEYSAEEVTPLIVQNYIIEKLSSGRIDKKGGLSPKTVTDQLMIIKDSFRYIQSEEGHPICNLERIVVKKKKHEMRVLDRDEERKLLTILMKNIDLYKMGVLLCLFTGIRIGELCALKWKNISIDDRFIKIDSTVQRLQKSESSDNRKTHIIISEPKSFAAVRVIPIPDFILEYLKIFKSSPSCYLLSSNQYFPIEPRTMQNHFKTYLKEGGIENANFHSLRHTFATRCVENGFEIKILSEILGHSSVKITLDQYVHTSMEMKRQNMNKLQFIY